MPDQSRPQRHLDLEGAYNLRELGGYPTADGRTTRWKAILRSGGMQEITPASQAAMIDYGVRSVIDLRRDLELEQAPNVFAGSEQVTYMHQNMMGDRMSPARDESPEYRDAANWWRAHYTGMLDHRRPQLCRTLMTISDPSMRPAVFHCAAGKDRTGVVAALLLSLARVDDEVIADDYSLSAPLLFNRYSEEEPISSTVEEYRSEHCPRGAMVQTLEHLTGVHGGVEAYLLGGGMAQQQIDALRDALVE